MPMRPYSRISDTPATLEEMAKNTTGTTSIFRALRNIVRRGVKTYVETASLSPALP